MKIARGIELEVVQIRNWVTSRHKYERLASYEEMGDENELILPMKWGFENMKLYSEHGALRSC